MERMEKYLIKDSNIKISVKKLNVNKIRLTIDSIEDLLLRFTLLDSINLEKSKFSRLDKTCIKLYL